jgi:hypothetical protein
MTQAAKTNFSCVNYNTTAAELSESLLDAITDLVAESGGCGLDQLSTDDGPVDDSVVTDTPDLRALRYVTG